MFDTKNANSWFTAILWNFQCAHFIRHEIYCVRQTSFQLSNMNKSIRNAKTET